jgi:PhzF family phenazine biosynthesis protein
MSRSITFTLVDVFARTPLSGNSLAVIRDPDLSTAEMVAITRELRQFESIFLTPGDDLDHYRARIFTMSEELDFAGHPVLGAAAALHQGGAEARAQWRMTLNSGDLNVETERLGEVYHAVMDQEAPTFEEPLEGMAAQPYLEALNLTQHDLHPDLPLQVVSTGLPYLIIPVVANLDKARITYLYLAEMLGEIKAKFVYIFDVNAREGRTWENDGSAEDIATGSAAGPAGAYLIRHGLTETNQPVTIHQGRLLGRPSEMTVRVEGTREAMRAVTVGGDVLIVGTGSLRIS